MRPRLLFADRDVTPDPPLPVSQPDLAADLELDTLVAAMSRGDESMQAMARTVLLRPITDPAEITYRQRVLADCLRNPGPVRELWRLAEDAVATERSVLRSAMTGNPENSLNRSVRVLELLGKHLRALRKLAARPGGEFRSAGFTRLFQAIGTALDDDYLRTVDGLLAQLRFERGIVVTARLGIGNRGTGFRLHEPDAGAAALRAVKRSRLTATVGGRDDFGWRALARFRGRLLREVAVEAARAAESVREFFVSLRDELGFYLGCVQLADTLSTLDVPVCWPTPFPPEHRMLSATELSEPCLALSRDHGVVGSTVMADGGRLILVTGPNQGGKSTFLRALGVAQLMTQAGMFVAAQEFSTSTAARIRTHFRREEDHTMASGRLDAELARMSALVDELEPGALLLCNESFGSTNEREAADLAAEIVRALTDAGVRIVFVTHLYELADRLHTERPAGCHFLRADRDATGERTFRITPGAPSPTAHGADLYARIFGRPVDPPDRTR